MSYDLYSRSRLGENWDGGVCPEWKGRRGEGGEGRGRARGGD